MNCLAIAVLTLLAAIYPLLKRLNPTSNRWVSNLLILNAFSIGATVTWLVVCWLRSLWLVPKGIDWSFTDLVLSPGILFGVESWVILGALGIESLYLRGSYNLSEEWRSTVFDGVKFVVFYSAIALAIFLVCWWFMAPGDYGRFEGSAVSPIVTKRADEIYDSEKLRLDQAIEQIGVVENNKPIPHAIALAAIISLIAYTFRPIWNYFQRILNEDYFHPEPEQGNNASNPFPRARGGGPN